MESQARADTPTQRHSISESVVLAVADAEGVEPEQLRPTLYDVVDPDALEQLFADSRRATASDLSVTFAYGTWSVQVHGDGEVSVIERPTDTAPRIPQI